MFSDRSEARRAAVLTSLLLGALAAFVFACTGVTHARDLGQWEGADPAVREWYRTLTQPDNPAASCCGEGDAYWADVAETKGGQLLAVITDDREDTKLARRHVPIWTRIVVPPHKIKFDRGNPTGHIVVFLNWANDVLCYVQNGGV